MQTCLLSLSVQHWINDGFIAIFFPLVGRGICSAATFSPCIVGPSVWWRLVA